MRIFQYKALVGPIITESPDTDVDGAMMDWLPQTGGQDVWFDTGTGTVTMAVVGAVVHPIEPEDDLSWFVPAVTHAPSRFGTWREGVIVVQPFTPARSAVRVHYSIVLGGLTPGRRYTYTWAFRREGPAATRLLTGGPDGYATMEVHGLPT